MVWRYCHGVICLVYHAREVVRYERHDDGSLADSFITEEEHSDLVDILPGIFDLTTSVGLHLILFIIRLAREVIDYLAVAVRILWVLLGVSRCRGPQSSFMFSLLWAILESIRLRPAVLTDSSIQLRVPTPLLVIEVPRCQGGVYLLRIYRL